ncbi:tigger transposable element-derived protein 4-like [Uloborus diversus]|uniref:tigger transposable element-derived protein 4-like n=1 Tax=Uloborus diversus TaxID=327109 RepID=UPI00240A0836|nr:tigger transposable element-derived protein 4-like [Uloborus diversus]
MSKRKLKILTIEEKVDLIKDVENNPTVKKKDLALKYGIPPNTLSTIMSNKEKILEHYETKGGSANLNRKKIKECTYTDIETALLKWLKNYEHKRTEIPVSGILLREKALDFGKLLGHMDFVASSGWLERFKARHNIVFRNLHGEAKDVPESLCEEWRIRLPTLLFGYKASDVFNIDETGLFYKCVPQKTLMFKGESCAGGKMSKDRLTVLVGANADGSEKLPLLVIGKSKNPRCFKNVKSLPVNYKSNKKSWMTSELFEEYVRKLDLSFHKKSREVLLFVDNCPAHPKLKNLKSIKLEFFPPNTTAKLQPADQVVICNLKVHYRKRVIRKLINDIENNKEHTSSISVLDALRMVFSAWQNDVSQDTIAHCFQKCGFFPSSAPNIVDEVNECLDNEFRDVFQEQSLELSDFVNVDSELITCGELCDEDIIAEVTAKEDGTDNEEKIEISEHNDLPTNADVSNALSIIHRSIESRENVPQDIFNAMNFRNFSRGSL